MKRLIHFFLRLFAGMRRKSPQEERFLAESVDAQDFEVRLQAIVRSRQ
jgi:hypothetical protein